MFFAKEKNCDCYAIPACGRIYAGSLPFVITKRNIFGKKLINN